jgi:hypothetical protein
MTYKNYLAVFMFEELHTNVDDDNFRIRVQCIFLRSLYR